MRDSTLPLPGDSQFRICPFLGLEADRTVALSEPSEAHRCYAQEPSQLPTVAKQNSHCLTEDHLSCPFYASGDVSAMLNPGATASRSHSRPWRIGGAAALTLVAISIVSVGIVIAGVIWRPTILIGDETVIFPSEDSVSLEVADTRTPLEGASDLADPSAAADSMPLLPTPTADDAKPLLPTPTPDARLTAEALGIGSAAPTQITRYVTPTPVSGGTIHSLTPKVGDVGWWRSDDERRNYLNDSFLYAGTRAGQIYVSAIRFNLGKIDRGARIHDAELRLTGLRDDQLAPAGEGTWLVQLVPESSLEELASADFLTLYSAPASIVLLPPLGRADLGKDRVNSWRLDAAALAWLEQQLLDGAQSLAVRIQASSNNERTSLFAWDSGRGPESQGNAPSLVLSVGPPPPTPPPLPTKPFIVATHTPVPDNVLTVVAQASTATAVATSTGTYTPVPFDVVTPTPFPANLATVQAAALARDLPPVVLNTPTPANAALATANANYATAVALTTGTATPVPTNYVTPILILPSPPAEHVATEAARVAQATAVAASGAATPTPLPHNAVMAVYVYATVTPGNAATAAADAVIAAAQASVQGTPTPLPWNAVVITTVPTPAPPTATPLPLVIEPTATLLPLTPTPVPDSLPPEFVGKILFLSDRTGSEAVHLLDPATGVVRLVTQNWVYERAREGLALSPDGMRIALVEPDIGRRNSQGRHVLQIKVLSKEYGDRLQITACNSDCYDPAWSPNGDRIAYVGSDGSDEEIYVVAADGTDAQQLTANPWEWEKHPSWSPDGTQIVFFSNRAGTNQLWLMNADGSSQRNLSSNEYNDWNPTWIR